MPMSDVFRRRLFVEGDRASVILDLLRSGEPDCETRIEQVIALRYDHASETVRLFIGVALTILTSLLIAYFSKQLGSEYFLQVVASAVGALIIAAVGLFLFFDLRRVTDESVRAMKLVRFVRANPLYVQTMRTHARNL